MRNETVEIGRNSFLKIEVIPVRQKNKLFYVGKVPAEFLLDIYTVEPAEYDANKAASLAETFRDDEEYSEFRLDIDRKESDIDAGAFERKLDISRVNQITRFLNKDIYALFPNTIIVTCDLINESVDIPLGTKIADIADLISGERENLAFLEKTEIEEKSALYLPRGKKAVLVIDGQHRLRGLEKAAKEVIDNYDVLVSFIVGFDRAVVAKLFYTINYTQKAVNKSLLYHLSGEFSHKLDETTFLHEVVRVLNEVSKSPFYKRIKMLGTVDPTISPELKEKMTISQAFLIDYLLKTISGDGKAGLYPPIFLPYYRDEKMQFEIIRFLMDYFTAVKQLNAGSWENPSQSMICKTIGVGAFIRVMYFLFVKMFIEEFNHDPSKIKAITTNELVAKLDGVQRINYRSDGPYGKVASGGSLNKLKNEIIEKASYFATPDYNQFVVDYRNRYLPQFTNWLKKVQ